MKILIVGCGRVGSRLAEIYDTAGHHVTVVDKSEESTERLPRDFSGRFVKGVALDVDALEQAGIAKTEVFVAATPGDNTNLVVGQIAKDRFKVPCVVVRCFDPNRARFFSERGLTTISPVSLTVDKIHETISEYRGEAKKR
jgi:trk system potassium uptake protein TrkA